MHETLITIHTQHNTTKYSKRKEIIVLARTCRWDANAQRKCKNLVLVEDPEKWGVSRRRGLKLRSAFWSLLPSCLHIKSLSRGIGPIYIELAKSYTRIPSRALGFTDTLYTPKTNPEAFICRWGASSRKIPPGIYHGIYHSKHSGRINTGIAKALYIDAIRSSTSYAFMYETVATPYAQTLRGNK